MKQVLKGTWVAEDLLERRKREFAEGERWAREKKKAEKAAKKAADLAAKAANPKAQKVVWAILDFRLERPI